MQVLASVELTVKFPEMLYKVSKHTTVESINISYIGKLTVNKYLFVGLKLLTVHG
ncbi:MAG: hypothetical protein HEQ35_11775 [Gloeotrichia echinulata IR180]|nr:hypothetical protein [Gloeotrichia echinulata DEX184]